MKLNPNGVEAVLVASKHFLRTREGFNAAPNIRGFARHIEATMRLYEAFAPDGTGSVTARIGFALWRLLLVAVSDTRLLFGKVRRLWRLN